MSEQHQSKVSGGASIVVGLIAMWLCYAVTSSVALSWAAFFVVGAVVFYSHPPR